MNPPEPQMIDAYEQARKSCSGDRLAEDSPPAQGESELALQARLFRGEFGKSWTGEDGEKIEVCHFGEWNREPGPDFRAAKVRINGQLLGGDIEVDRRVSDWEAHGHGSNPAFRELVLHVFFQRGSRRRFSRTLENRAIVQVCLTARPRPARVKSAPGGPPLDEDRLRQLVLAAAGYRLRRKRRDFLRAEALGGRDEALFQGLATGLGYKNNKIPFLLVAQRVGLRRARTPEGEALLFGVAGFLQAEHFDSGDEAHRRQLGELWKIWWKIRDREARLILPESAWQRGAVRPANHPHRRMAALLGIAQNWDEIREAFDAGIPRQFTAALRKLKHAFWDHYASLACNPLPRPAALVGAGRARDLLINVLLPGMEFAEAWDRSAHLSGGPPNQRVLKTLAWMGGGGPSELSRGALTQQGLLQIHEDFCGEKPEDVWAAFVAQGGLKKIHSRRDDLEREG